MRVVFMGSPEFALPSLRAVMARHEVVLVMSQPDKPAGRGKEVTSPPVVRLAVEAGLPTFQPRSARTPDVAEALRQTGADLGVVVAYGKILPRAVLDAFPRGCINVHGSVLPAYRGAAPVQWAVIHGDAESGVTIMQLDEGMDTGPMLLVRREPIRDDDTAGTLAARLAVLGAQALLEAMDAIAAGTAVATPQDHARATHAPMLEKSTGVIDWAKDAGAVRNLMRGVDPWPGATTTLGGEPLKLFGAARAQGEGAPGTVLAVDERGAVIACGAGAVRVAELQAPGKKRMAALELVRGRKLAAGAVLGP